MTEKRARFSIPPFPNAEQMDAARKIMELLKDLSPEWACELRIFRPGTTQSRAELLPPNAVEALLAVVSYLSVGHSAAVLETEGEFSVPQLTTVLGVPGEQVMGLLEHYSIPYRQYGKLVRVLVRDIIKYKAEHDPTPLRALYALQRFGDAGTGEITHSTSMY